MAASGHFLAIIGRRVHLVAPNILIKAIVTTRATFRAKSALVLDKMSDDGEAYVPPAWGFFAAELFLAVSRCVHLVSFFQDVFN